MFYFTPFVILPLFSALVTGALAAFAYSRRRVPAAWRFFHVMWVMGVWSAMFAANLCSTEIAVKTFLWNMGAVCAQLVALFALSFALEVTGNGAWLTRTRIALLSVVPAAAAVLSFSGANHQLFGYDFTIAREGSAAFLIWKRGPLFLVHYFYIMLLLAISTGLYVAGLLRAAPRERGRFAVMIAVTLPPVLIDALSISPVRGLSMVHSTFWLLGVGYSLAIFRYGLIDLVPVARERLFEEMIDPVFILDEDGRIAGANRSARSTFALGEGCIGTDIRQTPLGEGRLSRGMEGTGFRLSEGEMAVEVAGRFWHVTVTSVRDEGARKEGRLVVLRDVSELKRAEEKIRQALGETEKMSAAKSRFVSMMSHEMRTPLHAIAGSVDVLSETPLDDRQRRLVDLSARSCATLKGLMDDAMDRSLIEAGRMTLTREPVFLRPLLHDLREMFAEQFEEKGMAFGIEVAPDVPSTIKGDGKRLFQVLTNLIGNALKYTDAGEVRVNVGVEGAGPPSLQIVVRDTGIGIGPDRIDAIFEPFSKATHGRDRVRGGIGLGLSITRDIVNLMGGRIETESEQGKGSTFTVTLPLRESEPPGVEAASSPWASLPPGLRLLAVDDVPENIDLLRLYFEDAGVTMVEAADGETALREFEKGPFDCALLDMHLPGLSGIEVVARMRAMDAAYGGRTPVIGISADAGAGSASAAVAAGCDSYLPRPVSRERLFEAIRAVVGTNGPGPVVEPGPGAEAGRLRGEALDRCRELAAQIGVAAAAGDWAGARRLGHSIKGLGMTFGLSEAEHVGAALEAAADANDAARCERFAAEFIRPIG
ncbi:MAG: response regulator [Deltaproteobacteria bacterium]|nr:response regulator [Deltaproteobacteria bacterium]